MQCEVCRRELESASEANVMVDTNKYLKDRKVDDIKVICKSCCRKIPSNLMHNLWELSWLMEDGQGTVRRAGNVGIRFGYLASLQISNLVASHKDITYRKEPDEHGY